MAKSADPSLLRLRIQVGEIAVRDSRLVRIEATLRNGTVRVRDLVSGDVDEVPVGSLHSRAAEAESPLLDSHLEISRSTDRDTWDVAAKREQALHVLLDGDGRLGDRIAVFRQTHAVAKSTVYRWLARYRDARTTSALVARPRGVRRGARRLNDERERLVRKVIDQQYLSRSRPSVEDIVRTVHQRCVESGYRKISRNAIRARIQQLDPRTRTRARFGAKVARTQHGHTPGFLPVERILQSVQIDHALADIIVVDERDRLAIGRPWLTLAIDMFSRSVLGFYLALDPPAVSSVGMCLTQACLPKDTWLETRGLGHLEWPQCGLPQVLRADNGRDFRSEALRRGCREHGVALEFRPIATPHFGGHIERLIGSTMGRIHLLPGTTFSNPRERHGYASEEKAAMTLSEFETWLATEIAERYHRAFHRGLGATPLGVWEQAIARGAALSVPGDPYRFRISFLPMERRQLQRGGLHLFNVRYWSDALPTLVRHDEPLLVRYDPRNLSKIFVKAPDHSYLEVPYADIRLPPVSIWELRAARRFLAQRGETRQNQERLFWAHDELQRIVARSVIETRRARRQRSRREARAQEHLFNVRPLTNASPALIDYSRPPQDLPTEVLGPRRFP